ncbi:MAG: IS4 family transposase [Phycisphaerales bacterium]|nr:IS4 family transposase [Phycisphaerales bacterium]
MSTIAHWTRRFKSAIGRSESVRTVLDPERVEHWCREAGHTWRRSFWSPGPTLLCSLLQALNASKSLRAGVADLLSHLVATDPAREIPSADPSAFAQARRRLPERVFDSVLRETAGRAAALAGDDRRWRGRRVVVVDGTCVSMPDEPELQDAFPQPEAQAAGCGFPVARATALFCWGTGVVLDLRIGSLRDSELGLFRDMLDRFGPGDVVLADRHYCSYVDIARLRERGADVVLRLHQRRSTDFRQGTRLGPEDRLVAWRRPKRWPPRCGLSRERFEALPEEMTLRMVRTTRTPKGFRSREIVLVTTSSIPRRPRPTTFLRCTGTGGPSS